MSFARDLNTMIIQYTIHLSLMMVSAMEQSGPKKVQRKYRKKVNNKRVL